jgi:hypothetical protein
MAPLAASHARCWVLLAVIGIVFTATLVLKAERRVMDAAFWTTFRINPTVT